MPTASALIYLMHDSMRMPRPSATNQTTGTKSCVDGQQRVSLCVSHELTPFGFSGNRLPRRFQTTSHAARMFKALLGLTDSYLESLPPPPPRPAFTCTAADSAPRLTPPLFEQEGRAMKTLRATGAFNKQLQCRRDSTSSWD